MDHMDSLQERSEVFEHQTEALARQACVVARRRCRWRGIAGCLLVLGLLSLVLAVGRVEAQTTRNIPVSLCSTSSTLIFMSDGQTPRAGELICPIVEDVPSQPPKSQVDILRVNAFAFSAGTTVTVLVCSEQFDNPRDTVCSSSGLTALHDNEYLPIILRHDFLQNAWGPARANAFGYVRIRFEPASVPPEAVITGIFLFYD
jgi:hypothetical protein